MTLPEFHEELDHVTELAINAYPLIPRRSYYFKWVCDHIAGELPAYKYPRLRDRLLRYHEENMIHFTHI